jgi:hypothetical protein
MSCQLIYKNLKIKIQRSTILSVVLYGCETWSLTLREEHRLGVSENRVLKKCFDTRGTKWQENGEDCTVRSFITCTAHQILLG